MKTIDERGEEYASRVRLSEGTYKGDVVTAYVIGYSDASLQCAELRKENERLKNCLEFQIELKEDLVKDVDDWKHREAKLGESHHRLQAENDSLKKDAEEWKLLFNQKLEQVKNAEAFIEKLQAENESLKKLLSEISETLEINGNDYPVTNQKIKAALN